jgi:hypothetical protein
MEYPGINWPPSVNDRVDIKGTGLGGIVERIDGEGDDRRYILDVYGHGASTARGTVHNVSDAYAARADYNLDELEPAR